MAADSPSEPYILTLDIETRLDPEEVGWGKTLAGAAGISAVVVHSSASNRHYCFNDTNLEKLATLFENFPRTVLVTFNGKGFDLPVIQAILGRPLNISVHRHFDLYQLIKSNLREGDPKGALSLDAVCRRTLGRGKETEGSHAPVLAAEGRWLTLFRYCKKDVDLTRHLFRFAREHGGVMSHSGDLLPLPIPDWLRLEAAEATH